MNYRTTSGKMSACAYAFILLSLQKLNLITIAYALQLLCLKNCRDSSARSGMRDHSYFRQKSGEKRINKENISNRPANMEKISNHLLA